jgi:hypothetical protein
MSLLINKAPGITDQDERSVHGSWETNQKVQARLAAKGIVVPNDPPPFPIPEVTTTLVDANNADYLKVNAQYLAWLNYILPHLAITRGTILEAQNEKSHIETMYREVTRRGDEETGNKTAKDAVEDAIHLDPRYIELTQLEQEMTQTKYQLEEHSANLERTLKVISRHIEVKKLDVEMNRVNANMPLRRPFTSGVR